MPVKEGAEWSMILIAVASVLGDLWNRHRLNRGYGVRFIQFLGLTVLVPLVVMLSLEDRISQEMTGAIAAAAVGGVLASLGRKDEEG